MNPNTNALSGREGERKTIVLKRSGVRTFVKKSPDIFEGNIEDKHAENGEEFSKRQYLSQKTPLVKDVVGQKASFNMSFRESLENPSLVHRSIVSNLSKGSGPLITHDEMCEELGISPQTGYDWRRVKSPRYKVDLARLAMYLSDSTVRFRRGDVQEFAIQRKLEVKS